MQLWAVWGYDDIFGGLHGMKGVAVCEGTEDDAMDYGYDLADDVINSYSDIHNLLEASVKEECEAEGIEMGIGSIEEEDIRDEIYNSDLVYGCIELDPMKLPTLDINELNDMIYDDDRGFIEAYRLE